MDSSMQSVGGWSSASLVTVADVLRLDAALGTIDSKDRDPHRPSPRHVADGRSVHVSSPCLALGSVGAMPHNSSAAGHNPKRNTTRAASAAACVPTCAPIDALVGVLIAGTQRRFFSAASWVFWSIVNGSPEVTRPSAS